MKRHPHSSPCQRRKPASPPVWLGRESLATHHSPIMGTEWTRRKWHLNPPLRVAAFVSQPQVHTEFLVLHRSVPASTRLLGFRHTAQASGDRDGPRFLSVTSRHPIRESTGCGGGSGRWRLDCFGCVQTPREIGEQGRQGLVYPGRTGWRLFILPSSRILGREELPKLGRVRWRSCQVGSLQRSTSSHQETNKFGTSQHPGPKNKTQPMKEPPSLQTTRTQHERAPPWSGVLPFHRPAVAGTPQQTIHHLLIFLKLNQL
ncbi:hypothetical protein B0T18DRAFT_63221 [Schizothecium vesticola]|uniref:Uncharacterized protein n=1 Tax=Schizothecium vesticola TaxID=314040 RepID=A0AA40F4H0_9PEZI|nr:hypothetical protein B0T18DRAFT_63221 [Schizothecium vesticola]